MDFLSPLSDRDNKTTRWDSRDFNILQLVPIDLILLPLTSILEMVSHPWKYLDISSDCSSTHDDNKQIEKCDARYDTIGN